MEFKLLEWSVTGLIQGIPLALLVAAAHKVALHRRKEDQKEALREIISESVRLIMTVGDNDPFGSEKLWSRARKRVYDEMYKKVHFLLDHKMTELDYEDEVRIREAFASFKDNLALFEIDSFPSLEIYYHGLIKKLRRVEWLGIEEPDKPLPFYD